MPKASRCSPGRRESSYGFQTRPKRQRGKFGAMERNTVRMPLAAWVLRPPRRLPVRDHIVLQTKTCTMRRLIGGIRCLIGRHSKYQPHHSCKSALRRSLVADCFLPNALFHGDELRKSRAGFEMTPNVLWHKLLRRRKRHVNVASHFGRLKHGISGRLRDRMVQQMDDALGTECGHFGCPGLAYNWKDILAPIYSSACMTMVSAAAW